MHRTSKPKSISIDSTSNGTDISWFGMWEVSVLQLGPNIYLLSRNSQCTEGELICIFLRQDIRRIIDVNSPHGGICMPYCNFLNHSIYSPLSLEGRKEKNPINWTVLFKYCPLYEFACVICYFITVERHACLHSNSHECFKNPLIRKKAFHPIIRYVWIFSNWVELKMDPSLFIRQRLKS